MTEMATPQNKTPVPGFMKLTIQVDLYYIPSSSGLCLDVEKKIFKDIMHFHYMTYMTTPQHKNPSPGGHEIYNFGRPFLGHHHYILSLSDLCLRVKKKIFKGIMHFHYTTYMATPQHRNLCSGGHEIYNFGRPFLNHHYYILSLTDLCPRVEKNIF